MPATADLQHHVRLPRGGELLVRPVRDDDLAALHALYEALPLEDRYRRFFSAFRPSLAFLTGWIQSCRSEGCGLVAEVAGALVAEAGYLPAPGGAAELALTIAPGWRGWLGPYLLDLLAEQADRDGLPGLQAEVLTENRAMLTLLRHRGAVTLDASDATVIRVLIGPGREVPRWLGSHLRPRLLVETPGARWQGAGAAAAAGVDVITCPGPAAMRCCPAPDGGPCPLAAGADAVLLALRTPPENEQLARWHADAHPGACVVVGVDPATAIDMAVRHFVPYRGEV